MAVWRFTCYNGTVFEVCNNDFYYALDKFLKKTGLHTLDIKKIENLS